MPLKLHLFGDHAKDVTRLGMVLKLRMFVDHAKDVTRLLIPQSGTRLLYWGSR